MGMKNYIKSIQFYFNKKDLKKYSSTFLNTYDSCFSGEKICDLFNETFNENPALFDVVGNEKKIVEELMINYCHNEAFIKASLSQKLKRHNCVSLFELPVGDSRADLCSINGNSIAYEIKTIYDSTKRLLKQVNDYLTAFEYVYVVCPKEKTKSILNIVPLEVGVYEYDNKKRKPSFLMVKEASLSHLIDRNVQLNILRKSEIPNDFERMNDGEINILFKKALKKRYKTKWKLLCKNMNNIYQMDYQYSFNNF